MQQDDKKAEPFKPNSIEKHHTKLPVNTVVRIIRAMGLSLIVLNVLLLGIPLMFGMTGHMDLYERVGEFSFLTSIIPPTLVTAASMCGFALIIFFTRKRIYAGTLLRWGVAVSVATFIAWSLVSLLTTVAAKPVIYLYPQTTTDVMVQLDYKGTLVADYPPYDTTIGGWQITAQPDGTLTNHADGREYSYLFWEGESARPTDWDLSTGFVVKGSDTREFLQDKLAEIGLTSREYNEFIVYWYPKMKDNPYNLIHFAGTQYTDTAPLIITPTPDSMLRVFMVYKPLSKPVDITPQTLTPFTRTGFTVVEWGGTEVRQKS